MVVVVRHNTCGVSVWTWPVRCFGGDTITHRSCRKVDFSTESWSLWFLHKVIHMWSLWFPFWQNGKNAKKRKKLLHLFIINKTCTFDTARWRTIEVCFPELFFSFSLFASSCLLTVFDRRSTTYDYVPHDSDLSFSISPRPYDNLTTVSVYPVTTLGVKSVHWKLSVW